MDFFLAIATGLISGLGASILFWLCFFKYSMVKVCFSDIIARSNSVRKADGEYRYRIRISNIGIVNLLDAGTITTIRIKLENDEVATAIAPAVLDTDGVFSILQKQASYSRLKMGRENPRASIHSINLTENSLKEFQKSFYDTGIQQKAKSGTLTLGDIIDTYRENMSIRILLHGTDEFTGRRIFYTKEYQFSDIKNGAFLRLKEQWKQQKKSILTASAYRKWLIKALSMVGE